MDEPLRPDFVEELRARCVFAEAYVELKGWAHLDELSDDQNAELAAQDGWRFPIEWKNRMLGIKA